MPVLLLLLFLAMILLPAMAIWFLLGLFLLLPFIILAISMQNLILVPVSLWHTFTDKTVRRNHALEHATANVLEEKYGVKRVAGMAFKNGFQLYGRLPSPRILMEASREALDRLRNGESNLAVHPRCGTSLAIGQFLNALVFVTIFLFLHHFSLLEVILYFILTSLLAQPLGLLAQKYLTTSTDVQDVDVHNLSVTRDGQAFFHTGKRAPQYGLGFALDRFFRRFFERTRF